MLRTSVVVCTFNGQAYVGELLRSVLAQDCEVGEIIVVDDCSDDGTVEIAVNALAPVAHKATVLRNTHRLGAAQNFSRSLRLARGEIVFLADQDDVWHQSKVREVVRAFAGEVPLAVCHDARLINADGAPLGRNLSEALKTEPMNGHRLFLQLLGRNLVPGCTLAVRRDLLQIALPVPQGFVHDEWLVLCAAASDRLFRISDVLIDYRIHSGNQLGLKGLGWAARMTAVAQAGAVRRDRLGRLIRLREWCEDADDRRTEPNLKVLLHGLDHWTARGDLPDPFVARARFIWRELGEGRYSLFSSGWLSAFRDLLDPRH